MQPNYAPTAAVTSLITLKIKLNYLKLYVEIYSFKKKNLFELNLLCIAHFSSFHKL